MSINLEDIAALFGFSAPERKETRNGPRMFRQAIIGGGAAKRFWETWRSDKPGWLALGYAVGKSDVGDWTLSHWATLDGAVSAYAVRRAEEAKEEAEEDAMPADWVPDGIVLSTPAAAKLLPYQRPACMRLIHALRNGNALDASDTGTGKTYIALAAAAELGLTPCVIAPLAVLPSWRRAAKFLGVPLSWVINYEKIRNGRTPLAEVDADGAYRFTYLPPKPLLVWDEVQKCKGEDTKNSAMLRDAVSAEIKCLAVSATAAKDPTEMRGIGALLGLHDGSQRGWRGWAIQFGCTFDNGFKFYGDKRQLRRIHRLIFPLKGNRIRIADVPDFPETTIQAEALDTGHSEDIGRAYAKIDEIAANTSISAKDRAGMGMAALMAARREAEKGKMDLFCELAEEAVEEGRSVVIFVNFRDHVSELGDRLNTDCLIWGDQTPEERQDNVDAFNADRARICVVSLMAGGAGLSLHDLNGNFPRLALISPSFSAVDLKQALGRVHRAGALTKSTQRIIFAAGTIEEDICSSVREKIENIETINDGHLAPPSVLRQAEPELL